MSVNFRRLELKDWRQFKSIEIDLHPTLTVITGANGAGKSTLLNLFSRHFGWSKNYLSTPKKNKKTGGYSFISDFFGRIRSSRHETSAVNIGKIVYSTDIEAKLSIPPNTKVQYDVSVEGQVAVEGIFLPSHRNMPFYQQVSTIPTTAISPKQAYQTYKSESVQRFTSGAGGSTTHRLKEALISMAMFGEGNSKVEGQPDVLAAYNGFIGVLKNLLPEVLGFLDIEIRVPDVVR